MSRSHTNKLNIVAMVLLAAMVAGFVSLGNWQLSRAKERRAIATAIEQGRSSPPVDLGTVANEKDLQPWRPARAQGIWLNQYSVLLDNRNLDGRPGFWLATPLQLDNDQAVLVLRGWLPRPIVGVSRPQKEALTLIGAEGKQTVNGEIALRVPRLYELWNPIDKPELGLPKNWPSNKDPRASETVETMLRVQNLDLKDLSHRTGLRFIPAVLMQGDTIEDGLIRSWAGPSIDSDKNVGYAMQWFGFAAIAGLVLLGLIYRTIRKRPSHA